MRRPLLTPATLWTRPRVIEGPSRRRFGRVPTCFAAVLAVCALVSLTMAAGAPAKGGRWPVQSGDYAGNPATADPSAPPKIHFRITAEHHQHEIHNIQIRDFRFVYGHETVHLPDAHVVHEHGAFRWERTCLDGWCYHGHVYEHEKVEGTLEHRHKNNSGWLVFKAALKTA